MDYLFTIKPGKTDGRNTKQRSRFRKTCCKGSNETIPSGSISNKDLAKTKYFGTI